MAKHRTPQQLLSEALEKVNALKVKVAQKQIADDPRMVEILSEEKTAKVELAKAMKWLDPEKGLSVRIARLKSQVVEAEHNLENAERIQEEMKSNLDDISERKQEVIAELDVDSMVANMDLGELQ
jgi:hypothetical protein|tara:strand:- start:143 stop:517 length:375 start_codon:yes stop_codon:yes gene_type:complete